MDKTARPAKVVVLGVGNLLLRDEGAGIHVIQRLKEIGVDDRVELIDGGTSLLDFLLAREDITKLVIVDAIKLGGKPGKIYEISFDGSLFKAGNRITSLHQLGVMEGLDVARNMGKLPATVIIGIEPKEITYGLELSPEVEKGIAKMVDLILKEVRNTMN